MPRHTPAGPRVPSSPPRLRASPPASCPAPHRQLVAVAGAPGGEEDHGEQGGEVVHAKGEAKQALGALLQVVQRLDGDLRGAAGGQVGEGEQRHGATISKTTAGRRNPASSRAGKQPVFLSPHQRGHPVGGQDEAHQEHAKVAAGQDEARR